MIKKGVKILFLMAGLGVFVLSGRGAGAVGGDFSIAFFPNNPEPGTKVVAKIKTYSFDADRAAIVWRIDGKKAADGVGEKSVSFESPNLGKKRRVAAYVVTADGARSSRAVTLVGNDMDILWEAMTSTPVPYKGKALPSVQSYVKATAVPFLFSGGKTISASDLVYSWYLNFKINKNASGAGKQHFIFKIKDNGDYTITVRASNRSNSVVFERSVTVSADDYAPEILFYKTDPMKGVFYNKTVGRELNLNGEEISVRAEPFFFARGALGKLLYRWKMNGKAIRPGPVPSIVDFRLKPDVSGSARVDLTVNNPVNVLQFASEGFKINFGI
ncbi:MAG: hypothetical protein GXP44_01335 [bacterium]|nr:hypothetical protein [bacterium]